MKIFLFVLLRDLEFSIDPKTVIEKKVKSVLLEPTTSSLLIMCLYFIVFGLFFAHRRTRHLHSILCHTHTDMHTPVLC